ncbi:MAG: extracellular solute-binding protein [Saccharofermentans sp.]|nr:extracellular solute-binding protein [Saccharofermentans sp.]
MVNLKKVAACAMAFTMAMSAVYASGCAKKPKGSNEVISADSVWYNMEKHELILDYDPADYDYIYSKTLGKVGDYYAVETTGNLVMPSDINWADTNYMDYYVDYIDLFDESGNQVDQIDVVDAVKNSGIVEDYQAYMEEAHPNLALPEELPEELDEEIVEEDEADAETPDEDADAEDVSDEEILDEEDLSDLEDIDMPDSYSNFNAGSVDIVGDHIAVDVFFMDYVSFSDIHYLVTIDPATGATSFEQRESNDASSTIGSNEGIVTVGDYQVEKIWRSYGDVSSYVLNISDSTGLVNSVDLSTKLPDENIFAIQGIFGIDDNTLLIMYYSSAAGGQSYLTLDIRSGDAVKDENGDYSWLNNLNVFNSSYFSGIGNVVLNDEGIQVLDFDNNELSEIFSFDNCNVNRNDVSYLKLMSYTEDEIVLAGISYSGYSLSTNEIVNPQIIVFTKADSNPNAGKTVLTAATVGYIDYAMSEAVCRFNETNADYFIKFENKYKVEKHVDELDYNDSEEYRKAYDEAAIELSNQLTVDLMAGEGPDIIFDTSSLSQLNNDDYLLDISDRISTDGLFANVLDAAKTGEKLYQIPLTFGVTGLAVLNENVDAGQTGFTFEQYADFVSTVCNGTDPLAMDQTEFFIMCMEAMADKFVTEDGRIDYDNEAFRALAEFTNENIIPPIESDEDDVLYMGGTGTTIEESGAERFDYGSFPMYIELMGKHANDTTILGLPSVDGRGPMLSVSSSVAISAQTAEADACWAFVETLLSFEIQEYYAQSGMGCPICIEAYETSAQEFIDDYNESMAKYSNYLTEAEMAMFGFDATPVEASVIDSYESMINSCSAVSTTDAAITAIIREEMPAYFSGQKTLDDVISVMEDRIQTFLDERD